MRRKPRSSLPNSQPSRESPVPTDPLSLLFREFQKSGDARIFAEILDKTHAPMQSHGAAVCDYYDLPSDQIDVLHNEAAMRLLRRAAKFDCTRPLLPYFKSILTNYARDWLAYERRRKTRRFASDADDSSGGVPEPAAPEHSDPAIQAESNEGVARIHGAIDALPDLEGPVMNAKIKGHSRQEIADAVGCTKAQVSRILHSARVHLREALP